MLELNHEYTYQEICRELGWKPSSGGKKIKQIKVLEESYEFYHPENKKTHKPKKSYIFTKQLKEPEIIDGRKNNGTESEFPQEEFEYLFKCILVGGVRRNYYFERGIMNVVYVSNSLLYREFGFDIYKHLTNVTYGDVWEFKVYKMRNLFQDICLSAARSATITRICRLLGYEKNVLPKGILRQLNSKNKSLVPDNELLSLYKEYMEDFLHEYKCRSEIQAIKKGLYFEITEAIEERFSEEKKLYSVRRYNRIEINTDYIMTFKVDRAKKIELKKKFRRVVIDSIFQSVRNRCFNLKKYKKELTPVEKLVLLNYFRQMLKTMGIEAEYNEEISRLQKQIEETYSDDEEISKIIENRRKQIELKEAIEKLDKMLENNLESE